MRVGCLRQGCNLPTQAVVASQQAAPHACQAAPVAHQPSNGGRLAAPCRWMEMGRPPLQVRQQRRLRSGDFTGAGPQHQESCSRAAGGGSRQKVQAAASSSKQQATGGPCLLPQLSRHSRSGALLLPVVVERGTCQGILETKQRLIAPAGDGMASGKVVRFEQPQTKQGLQRVQRGSPTQTEMPRVRNSCVLLTRSCKQRPLAARSRQQAAWAAAAMRNAQASAQQLAHKREGPSTQAPGLTQVQ